MSLTLAKRLKAIKPSPTLSLNAKAKALVRKFARFSIRHTLRAGNKDADRLANLAVDRADGRLLERRRVAG